MDIPNMLSEWTWNCVVTLCYTMYRRLICVRFR